LEVLVGWQTTDVVTATILTTTGSQLKGFITWVIVIIKKVWGSEKEKTLCPRRKH
jgi:hypothetical protein